eukprot:2019847-Amphidinium_carterae.1
MVFTVSVGHPQDVCTSGSRGTIAKLSFMLALLHSDAQGLCEIQLANIVDRHCVEPTSGTAPICTTRKDSKVLESIDCESVQAFQR